MEQTLLPVTFNAARLSVAQADGTACVVCKVDYFTTDVPHVPVGFADGGQVFACESHAAPSCPAWCTGHDAEGAHLRTIGRVRLNRPGTCDLIAVQVAQSPRGTKAAVRVRYHCNDLTAEQPRVLWFSLREAEALAGMLDVLGDRRVAGLVRCAITAVQAPELAEVRT